MEHFFALLLPSEDTLWERARLCVEHIPPEEMFFKGASSKPTFILGWPGRRGLVCPWAKRLQSRRSL